MKKIDVDVVLQESGKERIPLFVAKKRRKHKILNPSIINRKHMYAENMKAIVYKVQVGGDTFRLYNDLVNGYPTTRWFVDGDDCELFLYMDDTPF